LESREEDMLDYRQRSDDSPIAWCIKHQRLIEAHKAKKGMTTAYQVTKIGIFPYAVCDGSCKESVAFDSACAEQIAIG